MMPFEQLFNEIEEDHLSGAAVLTKKAAQIFKSFLISQRDHNPDIYQEIFKMGKRLISMRPHMACIINLVDDLLYLYKKNGALSQCVSFLDSLQYPQGQSFEMAAKELSEYKTLLTHSYSSSVFSLIRALKNFIPHLKVIVTESRPLNEGVRLAEDLNHERIHTTFVTDAAAVSALERADFLLLGADFLTPKYFSNKVGSLALTLGASYLKKPTYVVVDETKYILCKSPILLKNSFPKEEVLEDEAFTIKNPYFEKIPTKHLKKILTPQGAFSLNYARKKVFKRQLHNKNLIRNIMP